MKNLYKTFTISVLALGVAAGAALASDHEEIRMLEDAKITLIQAIELAEKNQGGQAIDASIDDDSFTPTYEVSVVKDGRVYDVRIDGVKGEVIGAREDRDD